MQRTQLHRPPAKWKYRATWRAGDRQAGVWSNALEITEAAHLVEAGFATPLRLMSG